MGETCLIICCVNGHYNLSKILLDAHCKVNLRDNIGCSALYHAIQHFKGGNFDLITLLLDRKAEVDYETSIGTKVTPLMCAINNGYNQIVKLLIDYNCDVNLASSKNENTPLHIAALVNNKECVK